MGAPSKFRLSLKYDATFWYAVSGGVVVLDTTPYYIEDPADWEEVTVSNARNMTYFGLDRDYAIPYKFVGDGAKIMRHIDYSQGSEGVCQLIIEIRDDITWDYSDFTPNPLDLDFSAGSDERDYYTVPVKEAGLPAILRAELNTELQVPISAHPNVLEVDVNPLVAQAELKWVTDMLTLNYPTANPNVDGHITDIFDRMLNLISVKKTFIPTSSGGDYSPVQMGLLSTSSTPPLGTPEGQYPTPRSTISSEWNQNATTGYPYMLKPKVALTDVTVKGSFEVILFNGSGGPLTVNFKVAKVTFPGGVQTTTVLWTGPGHALSTGTGTTFTEVINAGPFNLAIGEELIIYYTPNGVISGGFDITIEMSRYITVTMRYATEDFGFQALRGSDVLDSIISQITGGAHTALSNLISQTTAILDSIPNNVLWTSGLAIRSQPVTPTILGPTYLKITLAEFLRTYNVLYGAGMSAESGVARIEHISRYFDPTTIIYDVEDVIDCTITKALDFQFNKLSIGWPNQTYDEVNGLDEYNTTQVYSFNNIRTPKELNLVSTVRADMWGIFFEWVKYVLEESKDSKSDNDSFILEVKTTPNGFGHYEPVTGADIPSLTGVIDPDNSFNAALSPKHCFFRNGAFIRGGLFPAVSKLLTFKTTDKNPDMSSDTGSGTIVENQDVVVGDLDSPLFQPYIITLDIGNIPNLLALLDATPYGVFRFTWRDTVFEGFPIEASIKPAIPERGQLKLLSSPLNDLTLLV